MSEEIQKKLQGLYKEMESLKPHLQKAEQVTADIKRLKNSCNHPEAYVYVHNHDEKERRSYDEIKCEHCGERWEERSGSHSYLPTSPKKMIDELAKFEEKYEMKLEKLLEKIGIFGNSMDIEENRAYQFILFYLKKGYSMQQLREKVDITSHNILMQEKIKKAERK